MMLRSLLFVPADSERKIERALTSPADALILDLEDAVAPAHKVAARAQASAVLGRAPNLWVRVNPADSGLLEADLGAVVRPGLAGVMLPKLSHAGELATIARTIDTLESAAGVDPGTTRLIVIATETPAALFALGSYAPAHPRLAALTWGAEDLSSAVGAETNREPDGGWTAPYQLARSLCLFAAAAAGVAPLDTLYADYRDAAGLEADCARARRDGFAGRLAIHPDQVPVINRAFTPDAAAIAEARAIVAAFEAAPEAGTVGIEGRMFDIPHLKRARRVLGGLQDPS